MGQQQENDITNPSIKRLFENKNLAFVATSMKDGSPQITPTWVDVEDNLILVNTAVGRLKQRNLARDPRVAVSVADSGNPYDMVTVRGDVVERKQFTEKMGGPSVFINQFYLFLDCFIEYGVCLYYGKRPMTKIGHITVYP